MKVPGRSKRSTITSLKDWPKVYDKIKGAVWLTEIERIQFARSLAATPDERWEMNVNCIRSLGLSKPFRSVRDLELRKAKLRKLDAAGGLWRLKLSNYELTRGQMFGAGSKIIKQCQS